MWDGPGGFRAELEKVVRGLRSRDWAEVLRREAGEKEGASEKFMAELCRRSRELLMSDSAFLELSAPIHICGDTHGQFTDLLRILELVGWPGEEKNGERVKYLFLGDYVDRGPNSIEVVTLLLGLKLLNPESVHLLRGNHEAGAINRIYGFLDECTRRYSQSLWRLFSDVFNCLPFCAVVGGRILCMHGGLSSELQSWEQLRRIRRPCDVPDTGLLCDLLWADPDPVAKGYVPSHRGVSFKFGQDVVKNLCAAMELDLVVRAHQVCEDGYEFFGPAQQLVTIFSAPNYCGEYDNSAACLSVSAQLLCSFSMIKVHKTRRPTPNESA